MAVDPNLGYDPALQNRANGIQTREQWMADVATSMVLEFLNADGSRATSMMMDAALWAQAGIPLPPQEYIGILAKNPNAAVPPIVYNSMRAMAEYLANNPQVAMQAGLTPPPTASAPILTDAQQADITAGTQAQKARDDQMAENQRQRDFDAGQAALDRAESARQFDVTTAEGRRQFNATFLSNLLNTAVELAKAPVDWLAYQYFMENINVPLSALNVTSFAQKVGAIPPTGPSSFGPVYGGPAAVDGDLGWYQAAGLDQTNTPIFSSVTAAAEQFPGSVPGIGAWDTVQRTRAAGIDVDAELQNERGTTLVNYFQQSGAPPEITQMLQAQLERMRTAAPQAGRVNTAINPFGARRMAEGIAPAQPGAGQQYGLPQTQAPAQAPPVPDNLKTGVYTGQTATPATGQTGSGAQNPQGTAMLQTIASETGIPFEQLQQMVPANLLAGGYGKEAIINSPAVQAVMTGRAPSLFRTAPVGDSKFGTIQAFGIPLGLRGGQDFQLDQFLKANDDMQQQQIGVVRATGQSVPTFFKQAQRTAPIGTAAPGAFGVRRF